MSVFYPVADIANPIIGTLYITTWTALWKIADMPIPGLEWEVSRKRLGCM